MLQIHDIFKPSVDLATHLSSKFYESQPAINGRKVRLFFISMVLGWLAA